MTLSPQFQQFTLAGLNVNNPTSIQFGPDGRLYVAEQRGDIKIARVEEIISTEGEIAGYQVVGEVETIELVKDIPNHNDDGSLNTSVKNRQITGLAVDEDENGNVVLYVGSSDPRIGGGNSGNEQDLDTNSSIISRLTLTDPGASLGDARWTKTDLVIGLPRSEENHSINGLDIRTEQVNGEPHQIMYVASGGSTNKGAPSNNFAWTPEYYYSAAILRVDLTQLAQIEAEEGLKGGTSYVDPYVYALPTLNDPTRSDNEFGQDISVGTTGTLDAEAGDTFGGNDGRNQAKFDADGPVQIYSMGYRNHYDVVLTEAGNLYTFDNGPNNGWGDVPLTATGDPVLSSTQIGTNNPNIDVDTGNDKDPDELHLVTEGFYAGHPNPVWASGSDAGLYIVDTSSGSPVVIELTDPSDPNNDPNTTEDDLPSDWDTVAGGLTNPDGDLYLSPGKNEDGSNKGDDGSLLTINSSSNGLTEYTADGLTEEYLLESISDNPNAEILVVASFNEEITFIEIESDSSQGGTNVTDTASVSVGGLPLDLTAVGNDGIDGNGLFEDTIWVTQFSADAIAVLTPGVPVITLPDEDNDGVNDSADPLQFDPANGTNTLLRGGETLFWDFNPSDSGENPNKGTAAEGPYNIGMTGWAIEGETPFEELFNLDNTIRGGAPGIIQVKEVGPGTLIGTENTQKDAIQTGFLPAEDVDTFEIRVPIFNPFSSDANNNVTWSESASMGFALGDGSMSNFVEVAVAPTNPSGSALEPGIQVTYEQNDTEITALQVNAPGLLNAVDDDQIELLLEFDLETFEATPKWRFQTNGIWSDIETIGNNPIEIQNGNLISALQGQYFVGGLQTAAVVSLTSTAKGSEPFTADFLDLTIESIDTTPPPPPEPPILTINDLSFNEAEGIVAFTVSLSKVSESAIAIDFETNDDTATAGNDYVATSGTVTFAPGETEKLITIDIIDDSQVEEDETFTLDLLVDNNNEVIIGPTSGTGTIIDNDSDTEVIYRINAGGQRIPQSGSIAWSADTAGNPSGFRVNNGGGTETDIPSVNIDLSDPSVSEVPGQLFETSRFDLPGDGTMQWEFPVAAEPSEYEVRLFFAEGFVPIDEVGERIFDVAVEGEVPAVFDDIDPVAAVGQKAAFGLSFTTEVADASLSLEFLNNVQNPEIRGIEVISLDNNFIPPLLSIGNLQVNEDEGIAVFPVSLSRPFASEVTVDFATADGSAIAGTDYQAKSGTLTFAPGLTSQNITIEIIDDSELDLEEKKSFTIELANPTSPVGIQDGTAVGTIEDDEADVEFPFNPAANLEILHRINVGGAPIEAANGLPTPWSEDTNTNPSSFRVSSFGNIIRGTNDPIDVTTELVGKPPVSAPEAIFQQGRLGQMQWEFPVEEIGNYEVRLFFAEISSIDFEGQRVFDVAVEGSVPAPFDDIDPFDIAGQDTGFIRPFTTPVEDGSLSLEFIGSSESPVLQGVEIYQVFDQPRTGEAVLEVTLNSNNVQISNFNNNSFKITNTGEKNIARVDIDVTNALYPDSVFDPFGEAGDTASKPLVINTNGGTGVVAPSNDSYVGAGGTAGFEGLVFTFDETVDDGFNPEETLGFSIDMDPNSVAGARKIPLDAGSDPAWDVGGISGAELIGSSFTVTFTDGTTATGQLQGAGNQGGSQGLADEDAVDRSVSLTVNGLSAGEVGTYDANTPSAIVNGPAGETARVVLTKGFIQPVTNEFFNGNAGDVAYAPQLEAQLEALAASEFPANNAVEFQTVDIELTGSDQDISNLFDFSGVANFDFEGEDELPLGFVASLIDPENNNLPISAVTDPIYLTFEPAQIVEPEVSIADVTVNEADGTATLTVNLSESSDVEVTVDFATADDTATAGSDYEATSGTLSFAPGITSQNVTVDILEDSDVEGDETLSVELSNPTNGTIADPTAIATIVDNDEADAGNIGEPLYRINVGGQQVAAADGSTTPWSVDTNGNPSSFRVGNGGSSTAGTSATIDTSALSEPPLSAPEAIFQTERWDPSSGDPMQWEFPVTAVGDYTVRLFFAETFGGISAAGRRVFDVSVEGSVPTVYDDIDPFAVAGSKAGFMLSHTTPVDDGSLSLEFLHQVENPALKGIEIFAAEDLDPQSGGSLRVSIADVTVNEAEGTATFAVSLSRESDSEVTVDFATADDTATAGSDYEATSGTLSFAPGVTSQNVTVDILEDSDIEGNETLSVELSNPSEGFIQDGSAIGTIIDNEAANPDDLELLYRINVGGVGVAAADGSTPWDEDTNTNPSSFRVGNGGANTFTTSKSIDITGLPLPNSAPEAVFQSERWDPASGATMQWEFPVATDETYQVRLYLAETFAQIDSEGERVFDVAVEGSVPDVFDNIDPFAIAGLDAGLVLSHTTTVADDSLSLDFLKIAQNPALKGIEVFAVEPAVV